MVEPQMQIPYLEGWGAEVGMLALLSWMYQEWEVTAPEGIKFSTALLGLEAHTAEALKGLVNAVEAEAKKVN